MSAARVRRAGGRTTWTSAPPVVVRRTGAARVHLVQVGGGPLGGDRLGLGVEVGAAESLAVRSAAATVVQPGRAGGRARWSVDVRVDAGGGLDWWPEPTVLADGADWSSDLVLDLAAGARAVLVEQVVLGRSGQLGGRARSGLRVDVGGRPVLATDTLLDGADPALTGPGGTGGARSVGTVLLVGTDPRGPGGAGDGDLIEGPGARGAWTALDGPGALLTVLGDARGVRALLAAAHRRATG